MPITADDSAKRRRRRQRKLIQNTRLRQHVTEMLARCLAGASAGVPAGPD